MSDQKQRIRRNRIVMSCLLEESEDAKLTGKENFFFPLEKVLCRAVSGRERGAKVASGAGLRGLTPGINSRASRLLHFL